jgi:hypothetical protein
MSPFLKAGSTCRQYSEGFSSGCEGYGIIGAMAVYKVRAKVWQYPGMAGWHFVYVDKVLSAKLKEKYGRGSRGFGSIPVEAAIGETKWKTSIFPDKKSGAYLLPLKAAVRRAEGIEDGDAIEFTLKI